MLHDAGALPATLGEWGLMFADGERLRLNDGVIPYDLNTPLFSDYSRKLRTVWMPKGAAATFSADRELDFPVGTIISKTFHYRKADDWRSDKPSVIYTAQEVPANSMPPLDLSQQLLLETRLLVRYADGWQAFPYVWNAAQTDATLEIAGDWHQLTLHKDGESQPVDYVVPDLNQCGGCHTPDHSAGDLRPLGPKAWQLNRPFDWWQNADSQLANWRSRGMLQAAATSPGPMFSS